LEVFSSATDAEVDMRGTKRRACMARRFSRKVCREVNGLKATVTSDNRTLSHILGLADLDSRSFRGVLGADRRMAM